MAGHMNIMPFIILNMGGEMIFILEHRLRAQDIPKERAGKVLQDVVKTMYSKKFLEELFRPQETFSVASTKQIFEKLAHSSIMKLNSTSMSKLFDLMLMGLKFQILTCKFPEQILYITINHMKHILSIVENSPAEALVKEVIERLEKRFKSFSTYDYYLIKQNLLRFLQNRQVKVSLFIQDKIQSLDGTLYLNSQVPSAPNVQKPGTITYFKGDTAQTSAPFAFKNVPPFVPAVESKRHAQAELIDYGDNMYHPNRIKRERPPPPTEAEETLELRKTAPGIIKEAGTTSTPAKKTGSAPMDAEEEKSLSEKTKKGLNNLADLIGVSQSKQDDFKLNLFSEMPTSGSGGTSLKGVENIITIDATDLSKKKLKDLEKEFGDIQISASASAETQDSGQELLDLMDAAGQ